MLVSRSVEGIFFIRRTNKCCIKLDVAFVKNYEIANTNTPRYEQPDVQWRQFKAFQWPWYILIFFFTTGKSLITNEQRRVSTAVFTAELAKKVIITNTTFVPSTKKIGEIFLCYRYHATTEIKLIIFKKVGIIFDTVKSGYFVVCECLHRLDTLWNYG